MPVTARLAAALLFLLAAAAPGRAEETLDVRCPVMPEESALARFSAEWQGKTVNFCCRDCVRKFTANPAAYAANLPGADDGGRPAWIRPVDAVWDFGRDFPRGTFAFGLLVAVLAARRLPIGKARTLTRGPALAALAFAVPAAAVFDVRAHWNEARRTLRERDLEHKIHFTTFLDYGDPPVPTKPPLPPRLEAVFYRGNDERSAQLPYGGHYRSSTFRLTLCRRADGSEVKHGDPAEPPENLAVRVHITRAPGTPEFFFTPERMANFYLTRESGHRLHREKAPADLTPLTEVKSLWEWTADYPLSAFSADGAMVSGLFYLCEKRFDPDAPETVIGSRFHYGVQFNLDQTGGLVQPASDLWMGSLYRSSTLRIWEVPETEWLSITPIPEIQGEVLTDDPDILGISAHQRGE